mgnify:CR=1 FL=1
MGRTGALLLTMTLLFVSLAPFSATPSSTLVENQYFETSGRALVDFAATDVAYGNSTIPASEFTQPNGTIVDYMFARQAIELSFTFQNAGTRLSPADAVATMEVWHPIGFIVASWTANLSLSGGQSSIEKVEWTPDAAHSHLSDDGTLTGGYILRGSVDAGVLDGNDLNDVYDENLIVAIYHDKVENSLCGDTDGDGSYDCPNALSANVPMWIGAGYEVGNDNVVKDEGQFQMVFPTSNSAEGSKHLQVSKDSGVYISNRHDRMRWAWLSGSSSCDDPGHGLGYGELDGVLSPVYNVNICKIQIKGFDFVSIQARVQAWGTMGNGDEVRLEADTNLEQRYLNLSEANIGATTGMWTPVIWNMTDVFPNQNYAFSFLFDSDNSGATQGIHVDDLMLFGIERVDNYTIDLDCNEPPGESYTVIPADPAPPSLWCTITNNGYRTITPTLHSKVSNTSWMSQFPIRIDSTEPLDHDNTVTIMPIEPGNSSEFWINLSIPAGSNVETISWSLWVNDSVNGMNKGAKFLDVTVDSSYSANFRQKTVTNPALTLPPSSTGNVTMRLQNTGNEPASWSFGAYFDDSSWSLSNLEWFDSTGAPITQISLEKAETTEVIAQLTAPDQATPGIVEITLLTNAVPPASAQSTWKIYVDVPIVTDLAMSSMSSDITIPSNGQAQQIEIGFVNNGNSDENYNLSILADYRLQAYLSSVETGVMDAFGGDTVTYVLLPMPFGLPPDVYLIDVKATSQTDPSYNVVQQVRLTVPPTYEVVVEDLDMSGQTFSAGESCRTGKWEVQNIGNMDDQFSIATSGSDLVTVELRNSNGQPLSPAQTPVISPGSSYNVTFCYAFVEGTSGSQTLTLTATSMNFDGTGTTPSDSGSAVFDVGTQGWVNVLGPNPTTIEKVNPPTMLTFEIHNRHPTMSQQIRLDLSANQMTAYGFNPRINELDREFQLGPDQRRTIQIEIDPSELAMSNLDEASKTLNFTLEIDADLDTVEYMHAVTFIRIAQVEEAESGIAWGNIAAILASLVVILGLMGVLFQVIMGTRDIEDEVVSLADYQTSLEEKYRSISPAPEIAPAPQIAPAPVMEPVAATPTPVSAGPPLPATGLPDGWTMEQWEHYGQQWLEQQGL